MTFKLSIHNSQFNLTNDEKKDYLCNAGDYIKALQIFSMPNSKYCKTTMGPQLLKLLESRLLFNMCVTTYQTEFIKTLYDMMWFNTTISLPVEVRQLLIVVLLKFNVRNVEFDKKLEEDFLLPTGYDYLRIDSKLLKHFNFIGLLARYRDHPLESDYNKKMLTILIDDWTRAETGNYVEIYKSRDQSKKDHITRLFLLRETRKTALKDTKIQKHIKEVRFNLKTRNDSDVFALKTTITKLK